MLIILVIPPPILTLPTLCVELIHCPERALLRALSLSHTLISHREIHAFMCSGTKHRSPVSTPRAGSRRVSGLASQACWRTQGSTASAGCASVSRRCTCICVCVRVCTRGCEYKLHACVGGGVSCVCESCLLYTCVLIARH